MSQAQMVPRRRAGATRPTPAEQKLGLLEFLVASEDLVEVATRSLEWLAEFCGLKAGMCLALDPDLNRLTSVAVVGVKGADITRFSLDVADRSHPLVAATFA
ncbi:MAG TPA: hypothetical protein VFM29_00820, partial [Vicinamibacteria bacterium]|nr:hypothetical protein [Vicinamibacteria bacterium]